MHVRKATNAGVWGPARRLWLSPLGPHLVIHVSVPVEPESARPRSARLVSAPAGVPGIATRNRSGASCDSRLAPRGSGRGPPRSFPAIPGWPSLRRLSIQGVDVVTHLARHVVRQVVRHPRSPISCTERWILRSTIVGELPRCAAASSLESRMAAVVPHPIEHGESLYG